MQTSVNPKGQPVAFAGLIADSMDVADVISAWSEETTTELAFGVGVKKGTADRGVKLVSLSADTIMGVIAHSFMHAPGGSAGFGDLGTTGIIGGGRCRLLRKGRIYVPVDAGVTSITPWVDRPWLRFETDGGSNTVAGRWGKASDTHNIDLTKVGVFAGPLQTAADGGKIAIVEFDFTSKP